MRDVTLGRFLRAKNSTKLGLPMDDADESPMPIITFNEHLYLPWTLVRPVSSVGKVYD